MVDLDRCSTVVTKYEPELDSRHPVTYKSAVASHKNVQGHGDSTYIARRASLNRQAFAYRQYVQLTVK